MHLKYSCMCTNLGLPQTVMENLGITYQHATPRSLYDEWWFWNCQNVPSTLPNNISELKLDPLEAVGNGLNIAQAKKIIELSRELKYGKQREHTQADDSRLMLKPCFSIESIGAGSSDKLVSMSMNEVGNEIGNYAVDLIFTFGNTRNFMLKFDKGDTFESVAGKLRSLSKLIGNDLK